MNEPTPPAESDLLFPLTAFEAITGQGQTTATAIDGAAVPPPYHDLLVHQRDMTGTLETWFGQPMALKVLKKRLDGDLMFRQVLLQGTKDGRTAEFGAIRIDLTHLDAARRRAVLDCRIPLGAILRDTAPPYTSHPTAFLSVDADPFVREVLGAGGTTSLYGRRNLLRTHDGHELARIIEILPPLPPGPPRPA